MEQDWCAYELKETVATWTAPAYIQAIKGHNAEKEK